MSERPVPHRWQLTERGRRWFDIAIVCSLLLWVPGYAFVDHAVAAILLTTFQIVPLLWRREHPLATFAAVALASAAQVPFHDEPLHSQLAFPVAVYSVARYSGPRAAAVALGVGSVATIAASVDWISGYGGPYTQSFLPYVVTIGTTVVSAWALGTLGRTRAAYVDALIERGEHIEHEAQQQVALAASAERTRIAREMHDVVAHGLTTIVVQADGARYAAKNRPQTAVETLETIAQMARDGLEETRRILGVLRNGDTGTAPQPRLPDIAGLVAGYRSDLTGLDTAVSDGVALTAYRIVQEALTNVRKHAGPNSDAVVYVSVTDSVRVRITDNGRGASAPDDGRGLGVLGMRERAASHNGDFEAGPRPGGGFEVTARIPL